MDIRVLRYFLAVAREQSFSLAAQRLYLSQPTLSRQLRELEEELGKKLLIRGNKGVTLTEEGMMLRKRAEEIVELLDKTEQEVRNSSDHVSGKIYIGAGETYAIKLIADTARKLQEDHPGIDYSIYSADGTDVLERLDKGLLDFGLIFQHPDAAKYESIEIPLKDTWGVLVRKDHELAGASSLKLEELKDYPLIIPRQPNHNTMISDLVMKHAPDAHIAAEYNLVYNASVLVDEGLGCAVTFDRLINTSGDSRVCFIPFEPKIEATCSFVWKRYSIFTKPAEVFLSQFISDIESFGQGDD
ncbi:MAG: LysR family transcriptional regulator [Ruminococcus sp.]|nr:LysR family transcriptional regulator [Ruminococcus sp.]MBR7007788.1 LysR family transcriptional regulator [Ruminococcus sp.]